MMPKDIQAWPERLEIGAALATDFYNHHKTMLPKSIKHVVFCGMGGSGIVGRIMKVFLDKKTTIRSDIIASSDLPGCVDKESLAIVVSYSGNTWETISVLKDLVESSVPVIVLAHGGRAREIAQEFNLPFVQLPESQTPRSALSIFLGFVLTLFEKFGVFPGSEWIQAFVQHAQRYIPKFAQASYFDEFLSIVQDLSFFHVWGISGDSSAVAYRAVTQFNENSKMQVVYSEFPELCHNLLVGFTKVEVKALVVMFYSAFLSENIRRAVEATSEILREKGAYLYKVPILGDTFEVQLFNMILWADFASCHVGQARGVEVIPVRIIDNLKQVHRQKGIVI
ncbi:MAG: SIS domain-containing protein [bacterium]